MSCHENEMIAEGLMDEFYEDIEGACNWMIMQGADAGFIAACNEVQLLDNFVAMSMDMMADGPL